MATPIQQLAEQCTIEQFLAALCQGRVTYAQELGEHGQYHLVRTDRWDDAKHTLGAFRPIEPLKSVFFQPRESLGATTYDRQLEPLSERIVIGVKNCDLAGLRIHDHMFRNLPPGDPRYIEAREKTILVTCDCTDCLDVCFCPVVGEQPYAETGFDINISPVDRRYLIEAGSQQGEQLLNKVSQFLTTADDELLIERNERRSAMTQRLVQQSAAAGLDAGADLTEAVRRASPSDLWNDFAKDCVECGACNFVCCTCHCFQLVDGKSDGDAVRGKQWDSCLLMNFARMAGGSNPRAGRAARLRNRFEKKFCYFPEVLGHYACDGCGRCSEVCTGNIDIRAVLRRAVDESQSVHADNGND